MGPKSVLNNASITYELIIMILDEDKRTWRFPTLMRLYGHVFNPYNGYHILIGFPKSSYG